MEKIRIIGDFHLSDITPRSWQISYFENCLFELGEVSKGVSNLIVLGDFFDKPSIPDAYKLRLINKLRDIRNSGCAVWSIVGNHDIIGYNMSESAFERTSIKLVDSASDIGGGYFKLIPDEGITLGGISFDVYNGCRGSELKKAENSTSLLLAHAFFNNPIDEILNLTPQDLSPLGYHAVFLGHDHEPHKDTNVGKTHIIRPGAFTRTSSHAYNLNRKPSYVDVCLVDGKIVIEKGVLDSALPSTDLFREECFDKKRENKNFESNLSLMFEAIAENNKDKPDLSLLAVLKEVGASEQVIDYLRAIHRTRGVAWS